VGCGGGEARGDGKRSASRVLFSGIGKTGERQARIAARDTEYEEWGKLAIIDTGSIDA